MPTTLAKRMKPRDQHVESPNTRWEDIPRPLREEASILNPGPSRPATVNRPINPSSRQHTTNSRDGPFLVDGDLIIHLAYRTAHLLGDLLTWILGCLLLLAFFFLVSSIIWFSGQHILQALVRKIILMCLASDHRIDVLTKVYELSLTNARLIALCETITGVRHREFPAHLVSDWYYSALKNQPWW